MISKPRGSYSKTSAGRTAQRDRLDKRAFDVAFKVVTRDKGVTLNKVLEEFAQANNISIDTARDAYKRSRSPGPRKR
jgi:hypothetical protein